jgi:two-component system chemotaxis response regulator CheB
MNQADSRLAGVVVIGCSTGGPRALEALLGRIEAPFPLPIIIAQHIMPRFEHRLAAVLTAKTSHEIKVVERLERIEEGRIYLAPGDRDLHVRDGSLLPLDPRGSTFVPSADVLFETAAQRYGGRVVACLLTGMGSDGARGLLAVREAGGATCTQLAATCDVDGMPAAARALGASQRELTLLEMAIWLRSQAQRLYRNQAA